MVPTVLAPTVAPRSVPSVTPVVLSVGGSVLFQGSDDGQYLRDLASLLRRLGREFPLVVTTGGGRTAREYIRLGRELGLTEVELDELGIEVTRLHARLLGSLVGPPAPGHPPVTLAEAVREAGRASPVILGGTEPGHTTDAVASLIAVRLRASRLVNATSVDGIYEADPRTHPKAKRLESLRWPEFEAMVRTAVGQGTAGQEFLFDALGAASLARAKIPLLVVQGRALDQVEAAVRGDRFHGSRVE
jgi:uridylate kinase